MDTKSESTYDYNGSIDLNEFREMVEVNAYYRAEKRGFDPHYDIDNWLQAEQEISSQRRYWFR